MKIRTMKSLDYASILELNNANTPAVSDLTLEKLESLVQKSVYTWVVEVNDSLAGFCIVLSPGVDYQSDNYRWVSERYSEFLYLDRVVISDQHQGKGYGRKLYEHWFKEASSSSLPLILEVNVKPRNEGSLIFHEKMGFKPVGEQDTEGGKKRVQYMSLEPAEFEGLICYCFKKSKRELVEAVNSGEEDAFLSDIKAKMKDPGCFCEKANPSGRCCLADIKALIEAVHSKK